jgi:hypothetical protein
MSITAASVLNQDTTSRPSLWLRFRRAISELRQLFSNRVRKHRKYSGRTTTEPLEPRALLSFSAGNVVVFRVTNAGNNNAGQVELV